MLFSKLNLSSNILTIFHVLLIINISYYIESQRRNLSIKKASEMQITYDL